MSEEPLRHERLTERESVVVHAGDTSTRGLDHFDRSSGRSVREDVDRLAKVLELEMTGRSRKRRQGSATAAVANLGRRDELTPRASSLYPFAFFHPRTMFDLSMCSTVMGSDGSSRLRSMYSCSVRRFNGW